MHRGCEHAHKALRTVQRIVRDGSHGQSGDAVFHAVQTMWRKTPPSATQNIVICAAMTALTKSGQWQRALHIASQCYSFQLDRYSFAAYLAALNAGGLTEDLLFALRKRTVVSAAHYAIAMTHFMANGDYGRAVAMFNEMERRGITPEEAAVSGLVVCYARTAQIPKAVEVLGSGEHLMHSPFNNLVKELAVQGDTATALTVLDMGEALGMTCEFLLVVSLFNSISPGSTVALSGTATSTIYTIFHRLEGQGYDQSLLSSALSAFMRVSLTQPCRALFSEASAKGIDPCSTSHTLYLKSLIKDNLRREAVDHTKLIKEWKVKGDRQLNDMLGTVQMLCCGKVSGEGMTVRQETKHMQQRLAYGEVDAAVRIFDAMLSARRTDPVVYQVGLRACLASHKPYHYIARLFMSLPHSYDIPLLHLLTTFCLKYRNFETLHSVLSDCVWDAPLTVVLKHICEVSVSDAVQVATEWEAIGIESESISLVVLRICAERRGEYSDYAHHIARHLVRGDEALLKGLEALGGSLAECELGMALYADYAASGEATSEAGVLLVDLLGEAQRVEWSLDLLKACHFADGNAAIAEAIMRTALRANLPSVALSAYSLCHAPSVSMDALKTVIDEGEEGGEDASVVPSVAGLSEEQIAGLMLSGIPEKLKEGCQFQKGFRF